MNPQSTPLTDTIVTVLQDPKYNERPAQKFALLQLHAETLEKRLNEAEQRIEELHINILSYKS